MIPPVRPVLFGALALSMLTVSACFSATGPDPAGEAPRLRLAMMSAPVAGLSPLSDDAFKLAKWSATETLVHLGPDGTAQPLLATAWERRDPTTWVFTLRDDVLFQDGSRFDAEAAARSLSRAASAAPLPRVLNSVGLAATAESGRLVVTTAKPDPLVPQRLSSPQLAMLSAKAYEGPAVSPIGTGTGAFTIVAVNGSASARLDRHDRYWNGRARAGGIDATFVPDGTARAAALRTGEADIVEAVPPGQASGIDRELLREVQVPRTNSLYLNTRTGVFADPAKRALARQAIDPHVLVGGVYEGRADPGVAILGPAIDWANAARTQTQADHILAGRVTPAAGGDAQLTLATYSDRAELPEAAVRVQHMLQQQGFGVRIEVREYQYLEADALAGRFDAVILSRASVLDSGDPVATLTSDYTCQGSYNIAQFCDPEVDAALAAAAGESPGPQRQHAIVRAEAQILRHDPSIPLVHERVILGQSPRVREVARDPYDRQLITPRTHREP